MPLLEDDVLRLFSLVPYAVLGKPDRARTYIAKMVRDADELHTVFAQYPAVRYEPLDSHYVLLRCLGGASEELIRELCVHYTWRGVAWAAWLAALAPDPRYRLHLASARPRVPHNQWLVDLALAEIDGAAWPMDPAMQGLVRRLRAQLSAVPLPVTTFRRAPQGEEMARVEAERERVRVAYRSGGLDAALEALRKTERLPAR